ncbi:MAG: phosphate ABC transporter permease PstA [Verrucomicrobiales bacterium]|nr:phosphate ABC transporter permease PstA [Verrucomicrobiales bacterium]
MTSLISSRFTTRRSRVQDWLFGGIGAIASLVTLGALGWILADLVKMGLPHLSVEFFTADMKSAGREGGIGPMIVSTFLILVCFLFPAIPLGVGCAFWLSEYVQGGSRIARAVTGGVDLLASVPSIVFGLFGMSFFCQVLGLGFSILSGGLTLTCMVLPILVRTTLSAMTSLPPDLRPAAGALGLTRATTLWQILLPAALPGIMIGITLGVGRALAETAALLFTSGYSTRWPESIHDSGRAISVHIYDLAMNIPNGGGKASASALVLLLMILAINLVASLLADRCLKSQYIS